MFLAALLFVCASLQAQTKVSGMVKDAKSKPVSGVSITIKDTYDGATTDSSGRFSFSTSEKGEKVMEASAIGYKGFEQKINLSGSPLTLEIVLKEEISELKAVVISAGSFEASDRRKATVLNPIDIVTTASGNGDVTGALKTLPGAQQVGESEGLFVRGGTASETKTFIDGTLVNNFFYSSVPNVAQRGRFSPFIFKGTVFSTGGYSALYGQALSSALILESIDIPERSEANLGISVIGLSGGFQQVAKDKKSSWGINYGYTNLWLAFKAIRQKQDFFRIPDFHTADANFRIKTSKNGMIKYYGYGSGNKMGFTTPSIDTLGYKDAFRLSNFNMYHNLSYKENIGKMWKMNAGVSYTNNKDDISGNLKNGKDEDVTVQDLEFKNYAVHSKGYYANAKLVIERRLRGLSAVRFGGEYNYSNDQPDFTAYTGQKFEQQIEEHTKAGFAETDIYVTNNMAAKVGGRVEHSSLLHKINVAPRVSLAYKVGNAAQASLAYGIYYQNPETRYLPAAGNLTFAKATHYIAQYQKVTNERTFRAEVFYKEYDNLLKTVRTGTGQEAAADNNGFGDAKGFEFFWRDRKTLKSVDYWVSYSFLDTKRDFLNFPYAIQPSFAARHTTSVVVKKFVEKWKTQFNGAYNYSSPRPYYNIIPEANGSFKFSDIGETPDYHNVSFSLNYLPNIGKTGSKSFIVYVFSVSNVFGFDQKFGYRYSYNGARREAIVPPSKSFVFIGAFISFGVDRSQDIINSNL
jgi:hypothetical protein